MLNEASGLAEYETTEVISDPRPRRPNVTNGLTKSSRPFAMELARGPGCTVLTVMFRPAKSHASPFVNAPIAAFEAA